MKNQNISNDGKIRSVEELVSSLCAGETHKYLYFWGHTGIGIGAHCLSQWYNSEFYQDQLHFRSAEHYMMYQKALLFSDEEIAKKILKAENPGKAKSLGRKVRNYVDDLWVSERFEIVVQGNMLKFSSSSELLQYLTNTAPRVLVESSPQDRIWGIGMDKAQAKLTDPAGWNGQNLLGFALMESRSRLLLSTA